MIPEPLFYVLDQGVNLYVLSYFLGLLSCLPIALWLARERQLPAEVILDGWFLAMACFSLAFILGGFGLLFLNVKVGSWMGLEAILILSVLGALVFYAIRLRNRIRPLEGLDILFPSVAIVQVIARIGCFSAGCCHGKPAYGLPWAVTFNHPSSASVYKGIPVHPTQLYMAAGSLAIFVMLLALRNRTSFRGTLTWVYLFSFGLLRFVVEFYRGDVNVNHVFMNLSITQLLCIVFIGTGATMLIKRFVLRSSFANMGGGNLREAVSD